ncbi:hypothetical protein MBLL_00750 (plasmid) [Methylobacterium bullatum]|uniref:Uncharacterized protein n=1 Tax=Methylobacterium bullatum TaxID=570505 RepID=A0A679K0K1_9HYPH|nr:hypothetical protein MBLL_00750 [Methylobacterium bullatum]
MGLSRPPTIHWMRCLKGRYATADLTQGPAQPSFRLHFSPVPLWTTLRGQVHPASIFYSDGPLMLCSSARAGAPFKARSTRGVFARADRGERRHCFGKDTRLTSGRAACPASSNGTASRVKNTAPAAEQDQEDVKAAHLPWFKGQPNSIRTGSCSGPRRQPTRKFRIATDGLHGANAAGWLCRSATERPSRSRPARQRSGGHLAPRRTDERSSHLRLRRRDLGPNSQA